MSTLLIAGLVKNNLWPYPSQRRAKKRHSLRRRSKIRIVNPRSILHTHQNPIPLLPVLAKITLLEIKRLLGKPIPIRKVMHGVDKKGRGREGKGDVRCGG